MALSNVTFNLGQGGLGRPLPGLDYVSGLIFYTSTLPAGFSSSNRIKQVFAVSDAEALGIVGDYSDATAAAGTYLITNKGAAGDLVTISIADINPLTGATRTTVLCTYTVVSGDSSIALLGASLLAAINANTINNGYSATFSTATLTITAPKSMGIYLNSGTPIVVTITGTVAGTITQFSSGVASKYAVWHYHIAEYFRLQPQGNLYIGLFAIPGSYTYSEITTLQNFAVGQIRQVGIFKDATAYTTADLTAIDTVCKSLVTAHKETIGILGADISGTSDISTLATLATLTANTASICIAQDGGGLGAFLYLTYGKSITCLGAMLGSIALAKVSESIAWVQKFNISNGSECATLAFANGKLYSDASITDGLLVQLENYRYTFLRKFVGQPGAGSYWNKDYSAIVNTSDYSKISDNRTIQKATRGVYVGLVPALNSPLTLNADGTLTDQNAAYLVDLANGPLFQMVRDGELSAAKAIINPAQNVLSTGTLVITVQLVQIGTAEQIVVNVGFALSIS